MRATGQRAAVTAALTAALLAAVPAALRAQALPDSVLPPPFPTCTSWGVRRVAVTVPPGRTRDEFRAQIAAGTVFPAGTEAVLLPDGTLPRLQESAQFQKRLHNTLRRLLDDGLKIDGTVSVLLVIDDEGAVREVRPNTTNAQANRVVADLWRRQRFEPLAIEGCRVTTIVHVPIAFSSDWSMSQRQVEARVGSPRP